MQLTNALAGKEIEYVARQDKLLVIHCTDGSEIRVAWLDKNGEAVAGEPVAKFFGTNVIAKCPTIERVRFEH